MSLGKGTHLLSDVIGRIPENLMSLGKGTHLLSEVIGSRRPYEPRQRNRFDFRSYNEPSQMQNGHKQVRRQLGKNRVIVWIR